jgi:hypothetical protein
MVVAALMLFSTVVVDPYGTSQSGSELTAVVNETMLESMDSPTELNDAA